MEHQTPAFGKIYTVTSPDGCTVTDAQTLKLIQTCAAGVQTPFVACGPSVIVSDDTALFAGPFDCARVTLGTSGGAGAPLTPDQLTAVENAVGGILEDVATKAHEAIKATGWISSAVWDEVPVGAELFEINGTPFYNHGSAITVDLATAINDTLGGLVVAEAQNESLISLEAHTAGIQGNTITLSTTNPNVYLSGETLTGGEDEVVESMRLLVDNDGLHFSHVPEGAVINTGGIPIDTLGGNVYHRTGSATFIGQISGQDKTTAVMSGKGFTVYHGSASASSPVIFKVSADASVDPYILLADADGNEKVRISGDANNPRIDIDGARVLAEENGELPSGSTKALQHMGVYKVTAMGVVDLQGLTVAAPSASGKSAVAVTAQLLVNYNAGSVVFPTSWVWLDGGAPTMEAGKNYCIAVRNDGVKTLANKAYDYTR